MLDAAEDAQRSFQLARAQIVNAGHFGVPNGIAQVAKSAQRPSIAVIIIPGNSNKGSLESLCVEALSKKYAAEFACMEKFFDCCPTDFSAWQTEHFDKARLRCMIASTYQPDPSRSTGTAFARLKSHPPAIDIADDTFTPIANDLKAFCAAAEAS